MESGTTKYPVVQEFTPKTHRPHSETNSELAVPATPLRTTPPRPRRPSRAGWIEFLLRLASLACVVGLLAVWVPRGLKAKPFTNPAAYGWLALIFAIDAAEAIGTGARGISRVGLRLVLLIDILTLLLYIVAVLVNKAILEKKKETAVSLIFLTDGITPLTRATMASFAFVIGLLTLRIGFIIVNWRRWVIRRRAKGSDSLWDYVDGGALAVSGV